MKCIVRQYGFGGGAPRSILQHIKALKQLSYDNIECMSRNTEDQLRADFEKEVNQLIIRTCPAELCWAKKYVSAYREYLWEYRYIKNNKPEHILTTAIQKIKLLISLCNVVSPAEALLAKSAIFPINVSVPILIQTPVPLPSLQLVEKKAKLVASNALSLPFSPQSLVALTAIDSPVKGALSNCKSPSIVNILKSAGTFSPK